MMEMSIEEWELNERKEEYIKRRKELENLK